MDSVMLIDGKNFMYRNHFAHRELTTSDGAPTGVLYGCLMGLLALANKLPEMPIAFVWDGDGGTWRHRLLRPQPKKDVVRKPVTWLDNRVQGSLDYLGQGKKLPPPKEKPEGYKAHRNIMYAKNSDSHKEALKQLPELVRILKLIGIANFKVDGLEGDDLIGILMTQVLKRKLFDEVIIHSTDHDFYQLLKYDGLKILRGFSQDGELRWMDDEQVWVEEGVRIEDWVSYRALVGDKSDNIPQLRRGLGPVKCQALLKAGFDPAVSSDCDEIPEKAWQTLCTLLRQTVDRKEIWEHARKSYIASRIVLVPTFGLFSEEVKDRLGEMMGELKRESFCRKPYSAEGHREFSDWLVEKEMLQLRGRIQDFNSLC